jgi:IS1 family transposase
MNKLSGEQRAAVVKALLEGNSIRAIVRMTGVAKNTVVKLLGDLGWRCAEYQYRTMRNLRLRSVQVDEIWSFCYAKERNVPSEMRGRFGVGDVWTYVALDADAKLVPCWHLGRRSEGEATFFLRDLATRILNRVQITTDGYGPYVEAVAQTFGEDVDYAQLVKLYAVKSEGSDVERRYSPSRCVGARMQPRIGDPDPDHISTSFVERQNLTMRMHMRRFTRLTNGFSKKVQNHAAAVALHFMWYNFGRVHQSLGTTPAMAAGVTDHRWTVDELVGLLDHSQWS